MKSPEHVRVAISRAHYNWENSDHAYNVSITWTTTLIFDWKLTLISRKCNERCTHTFTIIRIKPCNWHTYNQSGIWNDKGGFGSSAWGLDTRNHTQHTIITNNVQTNLTDTNRTTVEHTTLFDNTWQNYKTEPHNIENTSRQEEVIIIIMQMILFNITKLDI